MKKPCFYPRAGEYGSLCKKKNAKSYNYSIILFIFAALLHKYTSMSTKKERLDAICRIIQTERIGNQEELLKQLENSGFQVTQATLSRDIKQLKVVKVHDGNGNYVYRLPDYSALMQPGKEQTQHHPNIEFSGNLAVVKTRPGYAMGIASEPLPATIRS